VSLSWFDTGVVMSDSRLCCATEMSGTMIGRVEQEATKLKKLGVDELTDCSGARQQRPSPGVQPDHLSQQETSPRAPTSTTTTAGDKVMGL
jgi:hypothetical protein